MSKFASEQLGEQNVIQMLSGILLCFQSTYLLKFTWRSTYAGFFELLAVLFSVGLLFFEQLPTLNSLVVQATILFASVIKVQIFQSSNDDDPYPFQSKMSIQWLKWINYLTPFFYFSSSFIEEEHFLRYYLWGSAIISLILILPPLRNMEAATTFQFLSQIFVVLVLHRLGTSWNQTGQKWSHLKDLVDSLKESNLLPVLVPLSVLILCLKRRRKLNWSFVIIVSYVIGFKSEIKFLSLFLQVPDFLNPPEVILVLTILYLIVSIMRRTSPGIIVTNIFIILTLLLQKYENIPLVTIVLLQADGVTQLLSKWTPNGTKSSLTLNGILVLWFSNAVFFYQVNSAFN